MLSCIVGTQKINVFDKKKEELRKWSGKGILRCPICKGELIYKHGLIKVPHFAHKQDSNCDFGQGEPETKEHADGKRMLYQWLSEQFMISNVELEKWIPEIKLRPDIWFKDINRQEYCIEYQCSPTTLEHIKDKNNLYELVNIKPIWIFGTERTPERSAILDFLKCEYAFDTKEMVFYKNGKSQRFNSSENFYFEDGEIYTQTDIDVIFKMRMREILEEEEMDRKEKEIERIEMLRKQEILYKNLEVYRAKHAEKMKHELHKETVINDIQIRLIDKSLIIYNDMNRFAGSSVRPDVIYSSKSDKVTQYTLLCATRNANIYNRDTIRIFVPITLGKKGKSFIRECFPYSNITYKKGVKG